MLTFARQMDFRFHCLVVDKQFVTSSRQIVERLQAQLNDFLLQRQDIFSSSDAVKVYYDCGQAPVTNLLRDTFVARLGSRVAFAQGVRPERFKLFQLADLICSVRLVREKIDRGMRLTDNEFRFFGGPRKFLRNVYKQFAKKRSEALTPYGIQSTGLGSLNKVLNNLSRQDLLDFGDNRRIRKMRVGTWDVPRHAVDPLTLIPKL